MMKMPRPLARRSLSLLLLLGCGKMNMPDEADLGADLGPGADMRAPGADMTTPVDTDMRVEPPTVTGLPNCPDEAVTAVQLYTTVFSKSCVAEMACHSRMEPVIANAMQLKTKLIGQIPPQTMVVPYVTAGDIDKSYVMYKLTGQQAKVSGSGMRMPMGRAPLSTDEMCLFVNWIKKGAQ